MENVLLSAKTLTWIVSLSIFVGVVILLFVILLILKTVTKTPKKETVKVDEEFVEKLFNGLGGVENILEVSMDNGRLKFAVNDLDLIITDTLKELSTKGVFITGKNVKLLFKYDSEAIIKLVNERRK